MLTEAGMRMRRSFAAVMVDTAVSVTVIALIAAGTCPTVKTWFAADAIVGARIWIVRLSLAAGAPPTPARPSCRRVRPPGGPQVLFFSPGTLIWVAPPKT